MKKVHQPRALCALLSAACFAFAAAAATVEVDGSSEGMGSVSSSQKDVGDGTVSLTLKATAAKGYAFSGWLVDGETPDWDADARNPSLSGVTAPTSATVTATFIDSADDALWFDFADVFSKFPCGEAVDLMIDVDSASFPTLSFKGLPAGLAFSQRTMKLSGTPTASGVSIVSVTGVNGSGYRFSETFPMSIGDLQGEHLSGEPTEIGLGEYFHAEFDELFDCDGDSERKSTVLSGIPPGLSWKPDWDLLYGTPTKAGTYGIKAQVRFADGAVEVATKRIVVVPHDPQDYDVDLSGLDGIAVGDRFDSGDLEIGSQLNGIGVVSVKGLPTGLSVATRREDGGMVFYDVVGTVREAGLFTVRVDVAVDSDGKTEKVSTMSDLIVSDTPWRYLKVAVSGDSPEGGGTVSGGGAFSAVSGTSASAKPSKGFVFAGWRDEDGDVADVGDEVDYRSPSLVFGEDVNPEFMDLFALFATSGEDGEVELVGIDGETFGFSADEPLDEEFEVLSVSLPTLTAKGLPNGVSIVPSQQGAYRVTYDPDTAAKTPSPGRYSVALSAKNVSGAAASASFLLTVANLADERVNVEDDYGEYVPDVEIKPIDLSGAVDFGRGETLAVSGLPKGLSFNKSANDKKGIAANTITGTPTTPGYYTLSFTAKVVASESTNADGRVSRTYETAKATAFLTVLPYPLLSIDVDDDALAAGNTVSGGGNYKPGAKVTLRAKAAKGWVFAGWDGLFDADWPAVLNPSYALVADDFDQNVTARFVPLSDDWVEIAEPDGTDAGFAAEFERGVEVAEGDGATLIADIVETVSYPTVKAAGLPSGVKFDAKTLLLSGKPTKAGVYYATISAKSAGGYSFTRILRIAVVEPGAEPPSESAPANDARIDLSPLDGIVTGVYYPAGALRIAVAPSPATGAMPSKVTVSGTPAGLKASVTEVDGGLAVDFVGTPTKVARCGVSVKVTYSDKSSLSSKAFAILEDGGSAYLSVVSADDGLGTVSGTGVYAAGETVKLAAKPKSKCVFAGWLADLGDEEPEAFLPLEEVDGFDFRTASVSFPFRPGDLSSVMSLVGAFAASADDKSAAVAVAGDVWEIDPGQSSEFTFSVDSLSLPKVTAKNLPKGASIDLARRRLVYTPTAAAKSGIYAATLTAQNQSKASATASFEIRVANRTTDMIGGIDPDMDAYALVAGVMTGAGFIVPLVEDGVKLSVSGLPSGLSYKDGVVSGIPTKAGDYTVTFTATSGSGAGKTTGTATVTVRVATPPAALSGTFNGFVYDDSEGDGRIVGTVAVTATAAGKVSASVKTAAGTESLSVSAWTSIEESGLAHAAMYGKGGSSLALSVDSSADWTGWQLQGSCSTAAGEFRVAAQRNPFGTKDGTDEALLLAADLAGTYSWEGLKIAVKKTGSVQLSGKHDGISLSATTVLTISEEGDCHAKFAVFVRNYGVVVVEVSFADGSSIPSWKILST